MSKQRAIKLVHDAKRSDEACYRVLFVRNSIQFSPGTWLSKRDAQYLCDNKGWEVTVVSQTKENDNDRQGTC